MEQLARVGPQPSLKLGPHFSLECILKCRTISAWFHSTKSCVCMANLDNLEAKNLEDPGTAAGREYGADGF